MKLPLRIIGFLTVLAGILLVAHAIVSFVNPDPLVSNFAVLQLIIGLLFVGLGIGVVLENATACQAVALLYLVNICLSVYSLTDLNKDIERIDKTVLEFDMYAHDQEHQKMLENDAFINEDPFWKAQVDYDAEQTGEVVFARLEGEKEILEQRRLPIIFQIFLYLICLVVLLLSGVVYFF